MRRVFIASAVVTQCNGDTLWLCQALAGLRRVFITSTAMTHCNGDTSCLCQVLVVREGFNKIQCRISPRIMEIWHAASSCKSVFCWLRLSLSPEALSLSFYAAGLAASRSSKCPWVRPLWVTIIINSSSAHSDWLCDYGTILGNFYVYSGDSLTPCLPDFLTCWLSDSLNMTDCDYWIILRYF